MRGLTSICIAALLPVAMIAQSWAVSLPSAKRQRISMVQAAMIYQLTRYVEWHKSKGEELLLCLHDDSDLKQDLQQFLERKINGRSLNVVEGSQLPATCDLIYIPERDLGNYTAIIAPFKERQVLFISNGYSFIDMGGMVALVERQGRIGIELNMQMLQAADFIINPSLIDIATRVIK